MPGYVAERLAAFRESGVTTLNITPLASAQEARARPIEQVRALTALWQTVYIQAALDHLAAKDYPIGPADVARLTPPWARPIGNNRTLVGDSEREGGQITPATVPMRPKASCNNGARGYLAGVLAAYPFSTRPPDY